MAVGVAEAPVVSVVVPAYNVEPWLGQCLESVAAQSIGADSLELVAVDDGSTDGTGPMLDAFARDHAWATVVHQANSGGPGAPRNVGMALASGRYVFFLDADDYLAPEALERLVRMAERNGSDIVVTRVIGVEGRVKPGALRFRHDVDRADLALVSRSHNVLKLFRRSFIEATGLRFMAGVPGAEDGDFMQRAYLAAGVVSILGSYDAYFARRREGSQTTRRDRSDDLAEVVQRMERLRIEPVTARLRPGLRRDVVIAGHLSRLAMKYRGRWVALEPAERARTFEAGAAVVRRWYTPGIGRLQPPRNAVRLHCLAHGLLTELEDVARVPAEVAFGTPVVEGRRVYAAYPHFRDGSGIPDSCFEITGQIGLSRRIDRLELVAGHLEVEGMARLTLVGGTPFVRLRRWPAGPILDLPLEVISSPLEADRTRRYPRAGFRVSVDLGTAAGGTAIHPGSWEIRIGASGHGIERWAPASVPRTARGSVRRQAGGNSSAPHLVVLPGGVARVRVPPVPAATAIAERGQRLVARDVARLGRRVARRLERHRLGQLAVLYGGAVTTLRR